jgi:hypothetical protein
VLATEKLSPQQTSEARYMKARSLYETNRLDDAMADFRAITKSAKNATGAEAYYYIARIQYSKQDFSEVEKTINKLISYEYSNDDWNNKGMLLLADAYIARGETADAEVILQTLLDSKPGQEFAGEAARKLELIKEKSKPAEEAPAPGEMKLQFNQTKKDSAMFNKMGEEDKNTGKPK